MHIVFDDYCILYLTPIISIIQTEKTKCEADYLTRYMSHYLTYLMVIGWLLDEDWVYLSHLINICSNMQSEWLTQFCIRQAMLPQIPVVRPARPAKVISDLLDLSLQSVLRAFRGGNHTNARMQTRHYSFSSLHLRFKNLLAFCLTLCVWLIGSKCKVSVWASWFTLATVAAVGSALLWPNSQQTKEQKAKPMILKAHIINRRYDFILVDKIVPLICATKCFERTESASKINQKTRQFKFIKPVM